LASFSTPVLIVIYQSNINIDGPVSTLMIMKNEEVVVSFIGIVHLTNLMKATIIANNLNTFVVALVSDFA
jgi:hypothetical protein